MVFGEKREPREEGLLPDMVRRAMERSVNVFLQSDEEAKRLVGALLPKEIVQTVVQTAMQAVDVTKREAVEIIGREMAQFLQNINLSDEIRKVLTSVSFEIKTEVRFVPNEDGTLKSEVKSRAVPRRVAAAKKRPRKTAKSTRVQSAAAAPRTDGYAGSRAEASINAVQGAVSDAVAGTRSRVRKVVDRLAERTADLTGPLDD